jgi:hypothetical protein
LDDLEANKDFLLILPENIVQFPYDEIFDHVQEILIPSEVT